MSNPDPYRRLGVSRDAKSDEIKKAYRKLARELHPDRGGDAEKLKEVNAAWEILGDDGKRKLFDEFGHDAFRQGFDADQARAYKQQGGFSPFGGSQGGMDFEDILSMFGGGRARGGPGAGFARGPRRGQDVRASLSVGLGEALQGSERRFSVGNSGPITVRIPKGVRSGQTLRVPAKGGHGTDGGPAGDLLLEVQVTEHPLVVVDRDDLVMELPLTFVESILGGRIEVTTPTGPLTVKIPAGKPEGTRMRLKGRGLPPGGRGTRQGDLYLVLRPTPPTGEVEGLDAALEALKAAYGDVDVRAQLAGAFES